MSARPAPGDRVALLLDGSPELVDTVLLATRQGVVPVPMDPRLTAAEREPLLEQLAPVRVVTDPTALADLRAVLDATPPSPVPLVRPMHLTSGTTGRPKGVWSGVLGAGDARALAAEEQDLWGFRADDVHLVLSPLHHSAPLRFATATRLVGGQVLVPGPFDPARATAAIARHRPSTTFCTPVQLQRLFAHWDAHGVPDLASFRLVAYAGAPCPPAVQDRLLDLFPPGSTWQFYGSTEGQFTAGRTEQCRQHPGTVGRARPGRQVTADADGVLWCVVPGHARFSYWAAPEKTAAAWRGTPAGPAFTVGDLGRVDDEGFVFLEGRRDDLVITGGVNVYPLEVERALEEHPDVAESAVFGVPDERWGQRVCAAVVGPVDVGRLREFATSRLSPPKRPKDYAVLESLPRTATGKVRRLDLPDLTGLAGPDAQADRNIRR